MSSQGRIPAMTILSFAILVVVGFLGFYMQNIIPLWGTAFIMFFVLLFILRISELKFDEEKISKTYKVTGKGVVIYYAEIKTVMVIYAPETRASSIGLSKRQRLMTIASKDEKKITLSTTLNDNFDEILLLLKGKCPQQITDRTK